MKNAIEPKREENFSLWYQDIIKKSDLAEHAPVKGCMIIKPWGYSIWENIKKYLDEKIKETGHKNLYFPLFINTTKMQKLAKISPARPPFSFVPVARALFIPINIAKT